MNPELQLQGILGDASADTSEGGWNEAAEGQLSMSTCMLSCSLEKSNSILLSVRS